MRISLGRWLSNTQLLASSLRVGEWFFLEGGVNEKVQTHSWKGITPVLEGWIQGMIEGHSWEWMKIVLWGKIQWGFERHYADLEGRIESFIERNEFFQDREDAVGRKRKKKKKRKRESGLLRKKGFFGITGRRDFFSHHLRKGAFFYHWMAGRFDFF